MNNEYRIKIQFPENVYVLPASLTYITGHSTYGILHSPKYYRNNTIDLENFSITNQKDIFYKVKSIVFDIQNGTYAIIKLTDSLMKDDIIKAIENNKYLLVPILLIDKDNKSKMISSFELFIS